MNTSERSVIKDNDCLQLTTKTFDVLQYLIENAGKVLTKDEILGKVWEGNFVEESNLPVHISKLRKSLGDRPDNRFIETVQSTGYRFVAPITITSEAEWRQTLSRRTALFEGANGSEISTISIAVLPLSNESGDASIEYVVDGLTENIINNLSRLGVLRVMARNTVFSYKNLDVNICEVAKRLGVSRILTGRVTVAGDNLVVGVELLSADDSTQVWGGRYIRKLSDLLAVQEEISVALVEHLASARLRKRGFTESPLTRDPESYRLYLKGRYLLERHSEHDIYTAIDCFKASIALDPANIHSYAEIVEGYRSLYTYEKISYEEFLRLTRPILSGVSKGNEETDVVQVMYCDLSMLEWKFDKAEYHCRKALAINPNSLKGRLRYSDILMQSRNFSGAMDQLEKLMIIDPLSALIYKRLGRLFYFMGEYETALAYLDDALELEPGNHETLAIKGGIYTEIGNFEEALKNFEKSLRDEYQVEMVTMIGVLHARMGNQKKARAILSQVKAESEKRSGYASMLAHLYLALGKKNDALDALDLAYEQHEPDLRALNYDRRWNRIRNEAPFRNLVAKVGLPEIAE